MHYIKNQCVSCLWGREVSGSVTCFSFGEEMGENPNSRLKKHTDPVDSLGKIEEYSDERVRGLINESSQNKGSGESDSIRSSRLWASTL
jgi:hypothetical protein